MFNKFTEISSLNMFPNVGLNQQLHNCFSFLKSGLPWPFISAHESSIPLELAKVFYVLYYSLNGIPRRHSSNLVSNKIKGRVGHNNITCALYSSSDGKDHALRYVWKDHYARIVSELLVEPIHVDCQPIYLSWSSVPLLWCLSRCLPPRSCLIYPLRWLQPGVLWVYSVLYMVGSQF